MKRSTRDAKVERPKTAKGKATLEKAETSPKPATPAPQKAIPQSTSDPFPIVGIGASAGGLEAFTELLKHLPPDTGMGFVLVQHLDPAHASALPQILSKATSLPVHEATNDMPVERNHVYVIAPNTNLGLAQGVLKLQPRQAGPGAHRSIDFFFESLAQDQHECAIGVILSGTASDGTLGLEAIKAEGGITFAQDESAKYDSMPRSAIAAGCVDFVLSPENIAKELARIAKHPYVTGESVRALEREERERVPRSVHAQTKQDGFKKILVLLRNHSSVDFSLYKTGTIQRRIQRRMVLNKLATLDAYAQFLRGKPRELDALYSDLLISVTGFFRNPEAFEFLKQKVFPKILPQRSDEPLRVWVLGCSTGQEAYSLAMSLTEFFDRTPRAPRLQIFASDLNEALLAKARAGLYAKSVVQDVSPERLRRFFVEEDGGYRVIKPLREAIVFARQNLLSDPPFSRLDLISCRNLLIYLEPSLQKKAMPTFHYALKPDGCLFLGASETIGAFTGLFEQVDKKHKIYFRKPGASPALHLQRAPERVEAETHFTVSKSPEAPEGFRVELNAQREADRVTRNRYAPPGVLVNAELKVLEFRGDTNRYLKPATGQATFHVLKMAREGLMLPLRAALNKAKKEHKVVRRENVRVNQNGRSRAANFEVVPLKNLKERCYLIFFEDASAGASKRESVERQSVERGASERGASERGTLSRSSRSDAPTSRRRVADLETELAETRDYAQSLQEQQEAANEELQASNEEVTSSNEELQSINEELETSKEELESTNEELTTVNDEMASRNAELHRLNADLNNLQTSTKLAIVLLGRDLTIRRLSAQAEKQFNLLATDVGRPISNVRHNLVVANERSSRGNEAQISSKVTGQRSEENQSLVTSAATAFPLEDFVREVIDTVREREREVQDKDGRWYSLRARPYFTLDNKMDGAVLVLVDIDALKRTQQEIAATRDYAANTVETVRDPMLVLDAELRVESANQSFYRAFRVSPKETVGQFIYDLGDRQWNIPRLRKLLEEILPRQNTLENFQIEHDFGQLGRRIMLLNARRIEDPTWKTHRILLAIEDITESRRQQEELQRARIAEAIIRSARDPLVILDAELRLHSASVAFYKTFSLSPTESPGRSIFELADCRWDDPHLRQLLGDIIPRNSFFNDLELTCDLEPAGRRTFLLDGRLLDSDERSPRRILLTFQDISEVLQLQVAARESAEKFKVLFERSPLPMWAFDQETLRFIDVNQCAIEHFGYSHDEFLRMSILDVSTPEAGQELQEALARPPHHLPERFSSQRRKKSGEVVDVEVTGSEITLAGKRVWLASVNDITERKRAEEALRASEERLRLLVEGSPNAMVMVDDAGLIALVNSQTEKVFGYTRDELVGQPVETLVPQRYRAQHPTLRAGFLQAPTARLMGMGRELFGRRKEGAEVPVEIGLSPLRMGERTFVLATITDITERKRAEEALREAQALLADRAALLEKAVQERTAKLQEIIGELEHFSYTITHDMRAPLRAMQGFGRLLRSDAGERLTPESADYLRRIIDAARRMDALIQDALQYSKIVHGEIPLAPVEPAPLLRSILESYPTLQPPSAQIQIVEPLPPVLANEASLGQCFSNLLANAVKFVQPGKVPQVRVWAEIVSAPPSGSGGKGKGGAVQDSSLSTPNSQPSTEFVRLWFEDNGIGIAPEYQDRIFGMFQQLDKSFEGTGIGLSLVRKVAQRMGGRVGVESEPGKGSRFWLEFRHAIK